MTRCSTAACLAGLLAACGTPAIGEDASAPRDAGIDAPEDPCLTPDRACPAYVPPPGVACEGELTCSYESYEASCAGGQWTLTQLCDGCPWPIVERCDAPFAGTLAGATITLGPPGEARAFTDGERVDAVWGPQGSPMVAYSLRIEGVDAPPSCVSYEGQITYEDASFPLGPRNVLLHCGASRTIYTELLRWPCEPADVPVAITLRVSGVEGEASMRVMIRGDSCP